MFRKLDMVLMPIAATASNGMTEGMKTSLETAFAQVATDVKDTIATALPIGLGVMGVIVAITLAVKFFKGLVKK